MAQAYRDVLQEEDLTPSDEAILDVLHEGARTKGYLIEKTQLHRNTVGTRLDVLAAGDLVRRVHRETALYELAEDPREEDQ
jgi:DNA-binding IclR family transcriptional regulator